MGDKMRFGKVDDKVLYRALAIVGVAAVVAIAVVVVVPPMMRGANQAATAAQGAASAMNAAAADAAAQAAIPPEAKMFVEEFGSRYADPVSTYYAREACKATTGKDPVLNESRIGSYQTKNQRSETDGILGFAKYRLPLKTKIDKAKSVEIFNDYTAVELTIYMNLLAKNPTPEAEAVIDKEFLHYASDSSNANHPLLDFTADDEDIATLMEVAKGVVAKYGSAANYTVQPGSIGSIDPNLTRGGIDPNKTYIDPKNYGAETSDSGDVIGSALYADVVVSVDVYKGQTVTRTYENIAGCSPMLLRQPVGGSLDYPDDFTYMSIGLTPGTTRN